MKKLLISFVAMLSWVFVFVSSKGYAEEVNTVADSVEYNADLDGDGCILDVNYWHTFACYPR